MRSALSVTLLSTTLLVGCVDATGPRPQPSADSVDNGTTTSVCASGPGELFERRIGPLLDADRVSSCSKCHAPGVDLAAFVTGEACSSMACLVEQGMVDLDSPEDSRILQLIVRGFDPDAETTHQDELAAEEYVAFLEWIEWSSQCRAWCAVPEGSLECRTPDTPLLDDDPNPEPLDLEHYPCSEDEQARAFRDHVFPTQGRCGHCHAVNGSLAGVGDAVTWIDHQRTISGSKRTIRNLYALGALDLDNPRKSAVVMKPLHVNVGGTEHGGGNKFVDREDPLYVALVRWIEMQQACRIGSHLPSPQWPADKLREKVGAVPYPK